MHRWQKLVISHKTSPKNSPSAKSTKRALLRLNMQLPNNNNATRWKWPPTQTT